MKKNKILSLVAILVVSFGMPVYASSDIQVQSKKLLTYEDAIKRAKQHSVELKQNDRAYDKAKDRVESAFTIGDYASYIMTDSNRERHQKLKPILEASVVQTIHGLFDEILLLEKQIPILEKSVSSSLKELEKAEIQYQYGLITELELEQVQLNIGKEKDALKNAKKKKDLVNRKLEDALGMSLKHYTLEKAPNTYKRYEMGVDPEYYAKVRAEESIDVWNALEAIKIAQLPVDLAVVNIPGKFEEAKENRLSTKEDYETVLERTQQTIQKNYIDLLALQDQYEAGISALKVQETQLQRTKVMYEYDLISKLDYEKALIGYEKQKLDLENMLNQITLSVMGMEIPYLGIKG